MKIMKRTLIASLFACVLLTGCVKTVTRTQLDAAIQAHAHETVTWVSYAGSQDEFHYLHHSYTLGSDAYRISEAELQIDNPFPLTKDKEKWRPLKKHWEAWGFNLITEDSQHQPAPYFK